MSERISPNEGAPLPVRGGVRWYKVISPIDRIPLKITIFSPRFRGFWTHWVKDEYNPKGKVIPCRGAENCNLCRNGLGLRWTGYVAAWAWHTKDERVAALTEAAARALLPVLETRGTLRGLHVVLQRKENFRNAPVHVTIAGEANADKLPPEFDIMESLNRMWGLSPTFGHRNEYGKEHARRIDKDPSDLGVLRSPLRPPSEWNHE